MGRGKALGIVTSMKFLNIDGTKVPDSLIKKLKQNALYEYSDMVLKEDLYGQETRTNAEEQGIEFTDTEEKSLKQIEVEMQKKNAGYFRFVFD